METMQVHFQKKRDGTTILRCVRADGTATWQKSTPFFNYHDLTHYAIETTLHLTFGFYGILAAGWDIDDFGTPWPRGRIPDAWAADANLAENLAGAFDAERSGSLPLVAEQFNAFFKQRSAEFGFSIARTITEADIAAIRQRRDELFQQWRDLPPGETLTLRFP